MEKLQPWMRGPFELIRHAHGHLRDGGDTDRRIALIGFDNAIEVCIDVFIRLHPKLRGGVDLPGQDVEAATRNYHTKIEFLDKYLEVRGLELGVRVESILWYHQLRNELYHSGNGMVPEAHVVEGAAGAAIAVFQSLFGVEVASEFGASSAFSQRDTAIPYIPQNDQMEFLRVFIEFERALQKKVGTSASSSPRPSTIGQLWQVYADTAKPPADWNAAVKKALELRNGVAHGHHDGLSTDDLLDAYVKLINITENL